MEKFDLIIIGGGAGAFAAAIRANELKAKTAMINAGLPLGGTCVNVGCVPSKTLLWAGEVMHLAGHHGIPGITLEVKNFNFRTVVQDEIQLVARLREEKYQKVLAALEHVTFIEGKAAFTSPHEVEVNGKRLSADKFIIAVGSTANVPPIKGIREVGFITHREALKLERQPKKLLIVGAGPLGLEFGQMYARFGTKVIILQHGPSILPRAEPELTRRLAEVLAEEGVIIKTNAEVKAARMDGGQKILDYAVAGKPEEASGEEILIAAGIDEKQAIKVGPSFQTSQPHIFAVGDVTNLPLRLEPTAGHEGTLAAENALAGGQRSIDYRTVPWAVFTDPQIAGVGFTEEEQLQEVGVCACRTVSFADVPKAMIMRRTEGLIKMAAHPETRQIMGVHILAPNAGELIAEAMWLVKNKNTIDDVTESLPMFPTLAEAVKLAALSFTRDISKLSCCV